MPSCLPQVHKTILVFPTSHCSAIIHALQLLLVLAPAEQHASLWSSPPLTVQPTMQHSGRSLEMKHTAVAAGSELAFAVEAAEKSDKKVRVVSMPSWELFDEQDESYKTSVLPPDVTARVSIEVCPSKAPTSSIDCTLGPSNLSVSAFSRPQKSFAAFWLDLDYLTIHSHVHA